MAINKTFIISLVLYTLHIIQHKLHKSMQLLNLCPAIYILMQKAVILNTCCIVRKFLATVNKKCLVSETNTLQINHQLDATTSPVYYPDVYLQLNMFRASSCPSSVAQQLQ
jgi:hypothetical protein